MSLTDPRTNLKKKLADFVAEQIDYGMYLILDDDSTDDAVDVVTPCGSVDNFGDYRDFPILGTCKLCMGSTVCVEDGSYCYHEKRFDTHRELPPPPPLTWRQEQVREVLRGWCE
jgi:hypothetical protein